MSVSMFDIEIPDRWAYGTLRGRAKNDVVLMAVGIDRTGSAMLVVSIKRVVSVARRRLRVPRGRLT